MQAKDIPAERVLELVRACNEGRCVVEEGWHGRELVFSPQERQWLAVQGPRKPHPANLWDVARSLGAPVKVVRAKLDRMIRRGNLEGCACGCRGDFEVV